MHQPSLSRGKLLGMFPRVYEPRGYCSPNDKILTTLFSKMVKFPKGGRTGVQEGWLKGPLDCSSGLLLASMQGYQGVVVPQDLVSVTICRFTMGSLILHTLVYLKLNKGDSPNNFCPQLA